MGWHHDKTDPELSYLLLPEWWGQGLATESVRAVLDHAHGCGAERIVAETQVANAASIRLLTRLGMRFERSVVRFGEAQAIYVSRGAVQAPGDEA